MLPINTSNLQISFLLHNSDDEYYKNAKILLMEKKEINVFDIMQHLHVKHHVAIRIMHRLSKEKGIS